MIYDVKIDNAPRKVEYHKKGEIIEISIDGRLHTVDYVDLGNGWKSLLIDGCSYDALINGSAEHYSVFVEGDMLDVHVYDPRGRRSVVEAKQREVSSRQIICAPMAGRIVRFQAQTGEMVQDGDGLVVLEAMKMENELKSQGVGQVKKIFVQIDDIVFPGQEIMHIE